MDFIIIAMLFTMAALYILNALFYPVMNTLDLVVTQFILRQESDTEITDWFQKIKYEKLTGFPFDSTDIFMSWMLFDCLLGFLVLLLMVCLLVSGALWYILAFLGTIYGARLVADYVREHKHD